MPPNSWFCPKLTRGWRSAPVKSVLSERANRQSQREGEQRRGQSALYRRQRRLYAQNAARASWEFRGSHGRGRRERVRGGGGRAANIIRLDLEMPVVDGAQWFAN